MTTYNKIKSALKDESQKTLIAIHNDYCDANSYFDDIIKDVDAAEPAISHKDMASMNDTHYCYRGDGKVITFSNTGDMQSPLDFDDLAKWIESNDLSEKYGIDID